MYKNSLHLLLPFGPDKICSYSSRMRSISSHTSPNFEIITSRFYRCQKLGRILHVVELLIQALYFKFSVLTGRPVIIVLSVYAFSYFGQSSNCSIVTLYFYLRKRRSQTKPLGEDWWRERDSNPRCPFRNIHDFQSCSFDHSDTSPQRKKFRS